MENNTFIKNINVLVRKSVLSSKMCFSQSHFISTRKPSTSLKASFSKRCYIYIYIYIFLSMSVDDLKMSSQPALLLAIRWGQGGATESKKSWISTSFCYKKKKKNANSGCWRANSVSKAAGMVPSTGGCPLARVNGSGVGEKNLLRVLEEQNKELFSLDFSE